MSKQNQTQTTFLDTVSDLKQALAQWESVVVDPEVTTQVDIKKKTQELLKKLSQQIEELNL